jgi:GNAT superfamily N-acetyltransferase
MVKIRPERPDDIAAIQAVNRQAFGQADEAVLVDALRDGGFAVASLVAEDAGRIVGHILFSRLPVAAGGRIVEGAALAPMAVMPDRQREGIGSALVRAGLVACRVPRCRRRLHGAGADARGAGRARRGRSLCAAIRDRWRLNSSAPTPPKPFGPPPSVLVHPRIHGGPPDRRRFRAAGR